MTPSCAAPTQGSLPYVWPAHIWLRLTAGQMLFPSEPRPAASSAHTPYTHSAPLCLEHGITEVIWLSKGSSALVRLFLLHYSGAGRLLGLICRGMQISDSLLSAQTGQWEGRT